MISKTLLNILCCPNCKNGLDEKDMFLLCRKCFNAYPVLGNIPDMLIEDAWTKEKAKKDGFVHSIIPQ